MQAQQLACYSPHIKALSKTPIFLHIIQKSKTFIKEMEPFIASPKPALALNDNKNGAPILNSYSKAHSPSTASAATPAPAGFQPLNAETKNEKIRTKDKPG